MISPLFTGPLAPERNPEIRPQYFKPKLAVITQIVPISELYTGIVSSVDTDFVVGQIVRFVIPTRDGMQQLDGKEAILVYLFMPNVFIVEIDTTKFDPFNPLGNLNQEAFVLPVGDINSGAINSSGRINNLLYIDGSFKNVSPQ